MTEKTVKVLVGVSAFGAVGDGVTDDTTAIQTAINTGQDIYFPPGTYKITSSLVPVANTRLFGAGTGLATILLGIDYMDGISATSVDGIEIGGLSFKGTGTVGANSDYVERGIYLISCTDISITECEFDTFAGISVCNYRSAKEHS